MTTTTLTMVGMPPARPFSSEECAALVQAGIIDAGEQADVLAGHVVVSPWTSTWPWGRPAFSTKTTALN